MTAPDERVMRLAYILEHLMSKEVANAYETINERLSRADGYPTKTLGASPPPGEPVARLEGDCLVDSCEHRRPCPDHDGATLTVVERSAETRYEAGGHREQIRDRLEGLELTVTQFRRYLRTVIGQPTADDITTPAVPMCRDNQIGKHAADEWGNPHCPMTADKGGLCSSHWWQWYNARRRDGIRTNTDHQPAA